MIGDRKLTTDELQYVLDKMKFYNRTSGYIAEIDNGKIKFFDSKPSFPAAFVTKLIIARSLKNKLFNNEK